MTETNSPSWTIEELLARYRLEPDVRDVFVEGNFDARVVNWFLRNSGVSNVGVYTITCVRLDAETLSKHSLGWGNKCQVMACAKEIAGDDNVDSRQVLGIVDADYDLVFDNSSQSDNVLVTDFSCMEMYLFNERTFDKFITFFTESFPVSIQIITEELERVLQEAYLYRLANYELNLDLSFVDILPSCTLHEHTINFDSENYLRRVLEKSSRTDSKPQITEKIQDLRGKLLTDARCQMHGHDFIELFSWYLRENGVRPSRMRHPENVEPSLRGCMEYEELRKNILFCMILDYLNSS